MYLFKYKNYLELSIRFELFEAECTKRKIGNTRIMCKCYTFCVLYILRVLFVLRLLIMRIVDWNLHILRFVHLDPKGLRGM